MTFNFEFVQIDSNTEKINGLGRALLEDFGLIFEAEFFDDQMKGWGRIIDSDHRYYLQ